MLFMGLLLKNFQKDQLMQHSVLQAVYGIGYLVLQATVALSVLLTATQGAGYHL